MFYKFMFLNIQYAQNSVVVLLVAMEIGPVPWCEK